MTYKFGILHQFENLQAHYMYSLISYSDPCLSVLTFSAMPFIVCEVIEVDVKGGKTPFIYFEEIGLQLFVYNNYLIPKKNVKISPQILG